MFPGWTKDDHVELSGANDKPPHNGGQTYLDSESNTGNRFFAEAVLPAGSPDLYRPAMDTYCYEEISGGGIAAKGSGGNNCNYDSGFLSRTKATTGFSAKMWQSAPGSGGGTDFFLMPDQVTHNYVSSSGRYGKIELWDSGKIGVGDQLYGGRYVVSRSNSVLVNQKRAYDVPYGKDVEYKLTPEVGYILDKLYIDGKEAQPTGVVYKADGTVDYYTYKFTGDTEADELKTKDWNFDPRTDTEKGGFAHTIHVTWQPAITLDFEKLWDDFDDAFALRPETIDITLAPWPTQTTLSDGKLMHPIHQNAPSRISPTYTLSGPTKTIAADGTDKWRHTYINLPKYEENTYDETTNTGTLKEYKITEKLLNPKDSYYTEILPHVITKNDGNNPMPVVHIVDNPPQKDSLCRHAFTTEAGEAWVTSGYYKRKVDYKIVNRLERGALAIEKDSLLDDATDEFEFEVTLTHPHADFSSVATNGKYTVKLKGDKHSDAVVLPKGTKYNVTEKTPPAGWQLMEKQKDSGEILGTGLDNDVYFVEDKSATAPSGKLYIKKKDGTGFVDKDGAAATFPPPLGMYTLAPYYHAPSLGMSATVYGKYYFDKLGADIKDDLSNYRYGDNGSVHSEALDSGSAAWNVSIAENAIYGTTSYVYHESSNTNKASHTIIGYKVNRARFTNIETVDLKIGKEVDGNQASKDKYFKFELKLTVDPDIYDKNEDFKNEEIGLADDVMTALNKWVADFNTDNAVKEPTSNAATLYDASEMASKNKRDDDTTTTPKAEIKLDNGTATVIFYLQHGNSVTLEGLPSGISYEVKEYEEDYKPYATKKVTVKNDDGTTTVKTDEDMQLNTVKHSTGTNTGSDKGLLHDTEITFKNKRAGIIPTGIEESVWPALAGLITALLLFAVVFFGRRRRRHE